MYMYHIHINDILRVQNWSMSMVFYFIRVVTCRGNIREFTFEIYRSENDFYYGHSYIARHDKRIRFNGQTNDRCAANRELEIRETLVGVDKCKGEAWNMLMSSIRYIRMSLVLQEISYGVMCNVLGLICKACLL